MSIDTPIGSSAQLVSSLVCELGSLLAAVLLVCLIGKLSLYFEVSDIRFVASFASLVLPAHTAIATTTASELPCTALGHVNAIEQQ